MMRCRWLDLDLKVIEGSVVVIVDGVAHLLLTGVERITVNDRIIYEPAGHVIEEK